MKIQVQEKPPLNFLEREKNHYFDIFELEKMGHIPKHKYHDSLAARILLKRIALDNFGIMPERIKFEYRFDKPFFLIGDTTYYCTISHSKHYVACGISIGKEIGIDIEDIRERSNDVRDYISNTKERSYFEGDQKYIATIIWNIKEAVFKKDTHQIPLCHYEIVGITDGVWSVVNTTSREYFRVKNTIENDFVLSYTA